MGRDRQSPIEINRDEFKKIGHALIDTIAEFIDTIDKKPVTTGESPGEIDSILGARPIPENGSPVADLIAKASELLIEHSLFNGHPKFLGYITSSAAPVGALADLLAAAINPNVGANILSPMATAIEKQTIKWIAELIGVSPNCGGILVSGGNVANFTAMLAARTAKAPKNLKENGLANLKSEMVMYCSATTHTWMEKASILFGHGSKSTRWIPVRDDLKMDNHLLIASIEADLKAGKLPFMVAATAGDVSTGVVDDLTEIAEICKKYNLWFHVDGAYGIPAAAVPEQKYLFDGIEEADSIALDPHKWMYSPLEAGCTLVKDPNHLTDTFSSHPVYYNFNNPNEDLVQNYYEYGIQNSRGFRALKVWLSIQQVGRNGYIKMIEEDIRLSGLLYQLAGNHPELEAITQHLSITTLRFVPLDKTIDNQTKEDYLNTLNETLCNELQKGGKVFVSNALVKGKYCLRGCIVNFRTSEKDIEEIIEIIVQEGRKVHLKLQEL